MTNTTIFEYSIPVHRSLIRRDLIAGVSRASLIIVLVSFYLLVMEMHLFILSPVVLILFIVLRALTKQDEYLVEIIAASLLSPDELL